MSVPRPTVSVAFAFCLATLLFASGAHAREWFVAVGGTGNGDSGTPFGSIQTGIAAAQPGDSVSVAAGTYSESLRSVRDGSATSPITLRAAAGAEVVVTLAGELLQVDHAYFVVEGLVLDGQYAVADLVDVNDGATGLVLRNVEVRRATQDCIDMGAPADVLIEGCHIHHCLNAAGGQTDAHGITGSAVTNLVIRNTEIHTFSGDAVQVDPGRALPGWNDVRIEGCKLWTGPLAAPENGFAAGTVPGENAVDTKTNPAAPRATLTVVDTSAWGFRGGLISNMAAFNLKENIDATLDRVTVFDSEIAFRTRGPGANGGAWVHIQNAVVYDVDKAVRYEDDIEQIDVLNVTLGSAVLAAFEPANASATIPDVRNLLLFGATLPSQATAASNLAVDDAAFVDVAAADYHLAASSLAIDRGEVIATITTDRDGAPRPQGSGYDVGAYEYGISGSAGAGGGAGAGGSAGGGGSSASGGGSGGGAAGVGVGGSGGTAASAGGAAVGADSGDEGGCGCRTSSAPGASLAWACAALLFTIGRARRRRARRSTRRA